MKSSSTSFPIGLRLLLLFFSLSVGYSVRAESAEEIYKSANGSYKAGDFAKAIAGYEKLLANGYRTPEVYYNLGNSYYREKNIGKAILYFERAHKLAPDDEDISHNLKLASLKTVDKVTPVPQLAITSAWNNFVSSQSSKGWGTIAVALVWVMFILLAVYLFVSKQRALVVLSVVLFTGSLASVALAYKQYQQEENSAEAILLVPNTEVKSAPDDNSIDIFSIHEGVKFQILDRVGQWNKIRLADGKVGWIESNLFEKI